MATSRYLSRVPVTEEVVSKTTFVTTEGAYKYFRMPFDVKNSGATLVRGIREVLLGMAGVERRVIDDLMVFSSNWMTHLETLEELLRRFSKANLNARLSKCIFGTSLKSVFCVCSVSCSVTTKTISLSLR